MPTKYMTDAEICGFYRRAADQTEQIKILAQLNNCSTDEIEDILIENGMIEGVKRSDRISFNYSTPHYAVADGINRGDSPELLRSKNIRQKAYPRRRSQEEQDHDYGELYALGLSDRAIADKLGLSVGAISGWRKRKGIPANGKPGTKRKK